MVKKLFLLLLLFVIALPSFAYSTTSTSGYYRKNGTYVQPYKRTTRDYTRSNNFSTKGNYNPYSGRKGYSPAYKTPRMRTYRPRY